MLELLAKKHELWVKMVLGMGTSKDVAEDIVQSMYLRIDKYVKDDKKIMYSDDEVNRFFIYVTLKNMFISYKKSKYLFYEIREDEHQVDNLTSSDCNEDMENAFIRLIDKIDKEMKTWHRYDRVLSDQYFRTEYSLRDISKGTGISLSSIFNTMRNNKKILKQKFSEDWEDFKNGDYNFI